jgi:hypothetical protein
VKLVTTANNQTLQILHNFYGYIGENPANGQTATTLTSSLFNRYILCELEMDL